MGFGVVGVPTLAETGWMAAAGGTAVSRCVVQDGRVLTGWGNVLADDRAGVVG